MSALLEGEQNFALPSVDSEQAITPKTFSFSSWSLVLPPPDTLKRDLKLGEGADHGQHDTTHLKPEEPEQHNATQRPTCLKKSEHVAKDLDKAGGVWPESDPAILVCPQPIFAVEMGNVEVPNPGMVEA